MAVSSMSASSRTLVAASRRFCNSSRLLTTLDKVSSICGNLSECVLAASSRRCPISLPCIGLFVEERSMSRVRRGS